MESLLSKEESSIYDDLNCQGDLGVIIHNLQNKNKQLQHHVISLEEDIQKLCDRITDMKHTQDNLSRNISELYKTAKSEVDRKDRLIAELQSKLDDMVFRRNTAPSNFGFKRQRDEQSNLQQEASKRSRCEMKSVSERRSVMDNTGYEDQISRSEHRNNDRKNESHQNRNYQTTELQDHLKSKNIKSDDRKSTGVLRDHSLRADSDHRRRRSNSRDRGYRRDSRDNRYRDYSDSDRIKRSYRDRESRAGRIEQTKEPRKNTSSRTERCRDSRSTEGESVSKNREFKKEPRFSSVESSVSTPEPIPSPKLNLNDSREEGELSDLEIEGPKSGQFSNKKQPTHDQDKKYLKNTDILISVKDDPPSDKNKPRNERVSNRRKSTCNKDKTILKAHEEFRFDIVGDPPDDKIGLIHREEGELSEVEVKKKSKNEGVSNRRKSTCEMGTKIPDEYPVGIKDNPPNDKIKQFQKVKAELQDAKSKNKPKSERMFNRRKSTCDVNEKIHRDNKEEREQSDVEIKNKPTRERLFNRRKSVCVVEKIPKDNKDFPLDINDNPPRDKIKVFHIEEEEVSSDIEINDKPKSEGILKRRKSTCNVDNEIPKDNKDFLSDIKAKLPGDKLKTFHIEEGKVSDVEIKNKPKSEQLFNTTKSLHVVDKKISKVNKNLSSGLKDDPRGDKDLYKEQEDSSEIQVKNKSKLEHMSDRKRPTYDTDEKNPANNKDFPFSAQNDQPGSNKFDVSKFIEKQQEISKRKKVEIKTTGKEESNLTTTKTDIHIIVKNNSGTDQKEDEDKDAKEMRNIELAKLNISEKEEDKLTMESKGKNEKSKVEITESTKETEKITIISQVVLNPVKDDTASLLPLRRLIPNEKPKLQNLKKEQITQDNTQKANKILPKAIKTNKNTRESGVPRNLTGELDINIEKRVHKEINKEKEAHSKEMERVEQRISSLFDTPIKITQKIPEKLATFSLDLTHDGNIPELEFASKPDTKAATSNQSLTDIKETLTPVTEFQIFKTNLPSLEKSNSLSSVSVQFQTNTSSMQMKNIAATDQEVKTDNPNFRIEEKIVPVECSAREFTETKKKSFQDIVNSGQAVVENENIGYGNTSDMCPLSLDLLNTHLGQYKVEDYPNLTAHSEIKDMPNLLFTPMKKGGVQKNVTLGKTLNYYHISQKTNEKKSVSSSEVIASAGSSNNPSGNVDIPTSSTDTSKSPSSIAAKKKRRRCVMKITP